VQKIKKCYAESRRKGTSCIQYRKGRLTVLFTSGVVNAFCNTLLKERYKGQENEEEEVSIY
jgi:hypothetical protein